MKILFYADTVFSFGGVQRVLAVVAKALSECHDVTILTTDRSTDLSMYSYDESRICFDYIDYPKRRNAVFLLSKACSLAYKHLLPKNGLTARLYHWSFFQPRFKRSLFAHVNRGGYDVVIGVHAFLSLHLASVRHLLNVPVAIGWMHNSYEALFVKRDPYLPRLKSFFGEEMKRLDRIVVLTHHDANLFRSCLGLEPTVVYNPLTLEPRGKASAAARKFLAVGRFSPLHKGFDLLVKAFSIFAKTDGDWILEIVGEGPEEPMIRSLIASEGLEHRVTISPFTSDIQRHYASASVFVLSSRWEGQPLVLAEAMAHGLPVVASNIPVVVELLEGKEAGILFESGNAEALADALTTVSRSTSWESMSLNALSLSSSFGIDECIMRWNSLFVAK